MKKGPPLLLVLLLSTVFAVGCTTLGPQDSDSVIGAPDISATFIDTVLKNAGSPAYGIGQDLYQDGLTAHIKPSFALSIFHMESSYGLYGVAPHNHSIGNIRNGRNGYRFYATWKDSVKDFYQLIQTVYIAQGLTTVAQILPVYAPSSDGNNPDQYVQVVRSDMTQWSKQ